MAITKNPNDVILLVNENGRVKRIVLTTNVQVGTIGSPAELQLTGKLILNSRTVDVNAGGVIAINDTDNVVNVNIKNGSGNVSVLLPNLPKKGTVYYIKDAAGKCKNNNIVIKGNGLIDGSSTQNLKVNYGSILLVWSGDSWSILNVTSDISSTSVSAGIGLISGGTSGNVTLSINDSIVATVSGTTFTGVTKHNAGLSGSLTQLTDGTSYLVAGNNVTITTGSNGAVTIGASLAGGAVDGSGTAGKLAKFTASTTVGDSLLSESSTTLTSAGTAFTFTNPQIWTLDANTSALDIVRSGGSTVMKLDSSNYNVGINVSPSDKLHIALNDSQTVDAFTATGSRIIRLQNTNSTNGNSVSIIGSDGSNQMNSYIRFINVDHSLASAITFGTSNSGGFNKGERVRINQVGNVGIATTNPTQFLQVGEILAFPSWNASTTPASITLGTTFSNTAGAYPKLRLFDSPADGVVNGFGISLGQLDYIAAAGVGHVFYVAGSEKVRITSVGSVGIGTSNPAAFFEISGSLTGARNANLQIGVDLFGTISVNTSKASGHVWYHSDGTQRILLDSIGNIGIGSSATLNNKLQVEGNIGLQNGGYLAFSTSTAGAGNFSLYGDASSTVLNGPSSGFIGFKINNSEKVRLTSIGNVGIGLTTTTDKLAVNGSMSVTGSLLPGDDGIYDLGSTDKRWAWLYVGELDITGDIVASTFTSTALTPGSVVYADAGSTLWGDVSNFFWDYTNHRLGIGTSSPLQKIQVGSVGAGSTNAPDAISLGASYSDSAGTTSKLKLRLYDNGAGVVNGFGISANQLDYSTMGGVSHVWYINNAEIMRLNSDGVMYQRYNGAFGYTFGSSGGVVATGTAFYGKPAIQSINSSTAADTLALNPAGGYVGVGTTNPISLFHVSGSLTGNRGAGLAIGYDVFNNFSANIYKANTQIWNHSDDTERMRLDSSGNIGVGTATVSARLHVHSGATDEVARFESTGNPYISLYNSGVRQGYFYSNSSSVQLVSENSKPLYLQGATEIRLRTNTSTDRVIINSGGVVGINTTPAVTTSASKLMIEGDVTLSNAGTAISLLGNLYYDSSVPGWKYAANGYGWGLREDNAGKLQMVRAGNNSSGPNAAASISLTDLFTFDLVNSRVGLGTGVPTQKLQIGSIVDIGSSPSTATPDSITLGSSYSNAPGFNHKIRLWETTVSGVPVYSGLGISAFAQDYSIPAGWNHVFYVGGSEKMRLDSSGNVGIGTSDPTANGETVRIYKAGSQTVMGMYSTTHKASLALTGFSSTTPVTTGLSSLSNRGAVGTGTNHPLVLVTNDTEKVRITATGNVGIGTTDPTQKLQIGSIVDIGSSPSTATPDSITLGSSYSNAPGFNHKLRLWEATATGVPIYSGLGISAFAQDYSIPAGWNHVFYIGGSEKMRLDSSGNVGIGTTDPTSNAETVRIYKAGEQTIMGMYSTTHKASIALTGFSSTAPVTTGLSSLASLGAVGTGTNHPLALVTNDTERVRITATGNVGIGITTTTDKLAVNGKVSITGSLLPGADSSHNIGDPSVRWDYVYANNLVSYASFTAPTIFTTDLFAANVYAYNVSETYLIDDVGGSTTWVKLGTYQAAQDGRHLYIKVVTSTGYNAIPAQQSEVYIHFKTSNGSSVDSNGFAGDATFYVANGSTGYNVKVKSNAAGTSANTYEVWLQQPAYNGKATYTVECPKAVSATIWTHAGTTGSDPGSASSTVCIAIERFLIQSNVGIGTTNPTQKLQIGSIVDIGSSPSTATPDSITLGSSYSNTSGFNHKLRLWESTVSGVPVYSGLGISAFAQDYSIPAGWNHVFYVGGAEKARITSAGSVGIGTNNPAALFEVSGSLTGTRNANLRIGIDLFGSTSVNTSKASGHVWYHSDDTQRMIIDSTGNVGIATAPPVTVTDSKLVVGADITLAKANVSLLGNLYYDTTATTWKYTANGYGWGFREDNAGKLQMLRAGNNSGGAGATASVSLTDLLTFDLVNNRVGLGTGSPGVSLDVNGKVRLRDDVGVDAGKYMYFGREESFGGSDTGGSDYGYIVFNNDDNNYNYWGDSAENSSLIIGSQNDGANSVSDVVVLKGAAANIFDSPSYINLFPGSNKVGIGTTNPTQLLQVGAALAFPSWTASTAPATITLGTTFSSVAGAYPKLRLFDSPADGVVNGFGISSGQIDYIAASAISHVFYIGGSEKMRLDSSGNVGIGTSDPTANGETVRIYKAGSQTVMGMYSTTHKVSIALTGFSSTTPVTTGLSSLSNRGAVGTGTNHPLALVTNDTEKVRIDTSGNVGIGETSMGAVLDVVGGGIPGGGSLTASLRLRGAATSGYGYIQIGASSTSTNNWHFGSEGDGTFRYWNGNFGAANGERLRISSGGDVGVGTTNSAGIRLHVHSGATDEVARFEGTGNPYISIYGSNTRNAYLYSNASSVELVSENNKPLYMQAATEIRFRTNGTNDRVTIDSSGNIGFGTTQPSYYFDVRGSSQMQSIFPRVNNSYNIGYDLGIFGVAAYANVYAYAYPAPSDYRFKKNVEEITGSLERISRLRPITYEYNDLQENVENLGTRVGFIAHELQEQFPNLVSGEKDGFHENGRPKSQLIYQDDLIPYMVDAMKQLKLENDALKSELQSLKNQIGDIIHMINNK